MRRIWQEINGFIWWTHNRGSLRYDIMVALILAFIFFTPRRVFRDLPPAAVEALRPGEYRVEVMALVPSGSSLDTTLANAVREHTGQAVHIVRSEPVRDAVGTLLAYRVWVDTGKAGLDKSK